MKNEDIRQVAKTAGVKLWQVAEVVGVNDGNFSRKLRHELPEDEKQKILEIIDRLSKEASA
jgi:predicted XRE-type DNA-binding protein